jgi:hypothetical protein
MDVVGTESMQDSLSEGDGMAFITQGAAEARAADEKDIVHAKELMTDFLDKHDGARIGEVQSHLLDQGIYSESVFSDALVRLLAENRFALDENRLLHDVATDGKTVR